MLHRFLLLITAIVGVNCTNFFPPALKDIHKPLIIKRLYVDDTFSASEVRCVESAAAQWTSRTKGLAKIAIVPVTRSNVAIPVSTDRDDIIVRRVTSDDAIVYFIERTSGARLFGYHQPMQDHSEITMVVDRYVNEDACVVVVMHEIGHALGLHHNDDSTSLMYGGADVMPTRITKKDLSNFCSVHGCRPDDLDD